LLKFQKPKFNWLREGSEEHQGQLRRVWEGRDPSEKSKPSPRSAVSYGVWQHSSALCCETLS